MDKGIRVTINAMTEDDCKKQKDMEYFEYIENHVNNVKTAYSMLFKPFLRQLYTSDKQLLSNYSNQQVIHAIMEASVLVKNHDRSKYSTCEFYGYRIKYYPTYQEKNKDTEKYNKESAIKLQSAWVSHYTNNPHHPEHWCKMVNSTMVPDRDMELPYIIEMLSDWQAMSFYYQSSLRDWWGGEHGDEKRKIMTRKTVQTVNELLKILPIFNMVG